MLIIINDRICRKNTFHVQLDKKVNSDHEIFIQRFYNKWSKERSLLKSIIDSRCPFYKNKILIVHGLEKPTYCY